MSEAENTVDAKIFNLSKSAPADLPDVAVGKDGWLFLVGGANRVLDFYTRPETFSDATVSKWITLLRDRREKCQTAGVKYYHMFAPEKLSVYFDKYIGDLPFRSRTPANIVPVAAEAAGIGNVVIDALPDMLQMKHRQKLFFQTDTHWTFEGCYCAMQKLCGHLGVAPSPTIIAGERRRGLVALDLGAKLTPPVQEEYTMVAFLNSARRVAVNSMVAFKEKTQRQNDAGLHVGSNVVFINTQSAAADKTIVLFGDSFSEYRGHLLTGMLAETFREVHFVWSTNLDWSYIERVKPDILLTVSSERFALQIPQDDFDVDRFVVRRLAAMMT